MHVMADLASGAPASSVQGAFSPSKLNFDNYICPITLEFMEDPVCTRTGQTFERSAIEEWVHKHGRCPITNEPLSINELYPCYTLKAAIDDARQSCQGVAPQPSASFRRVEATVVEPVRNRGRMAILRACRDEGVQEVTADRIWRCWQCRFPATSTYVVFPSPEGFLFFQATGYIGFKNNSDVDVVELVSHRMTSDGFSKEGGKRILQPGAQESYDFRMPGWCVEVRRGDAAALEVFEFGRRGGGRGDGLGMYEDD
eukprot:TRINITY_DN6844_c0_g1_i1.p1 TRINITY_DN6844_c0_g1~~TRINITY_DN6844_c0_g1_i1.p1  ORF type:complete len:256 (-),score=6.32 TRINITY_DN6844_c0_g1_i1:79-846(-)